MSIILEAVRIREALRAPTLASLNGDPRPRQAVPRVLAGAVVLALIVLAAGRVGLRTAAPPPSAEADIPMLQSAARRPAARTLVAMSAAPPAAQPLPGAAIQPLPQRTPAVPAPAAQAAKFTAPAAAAFRPPTTLKQAIPAPAAALPAGRAAGRVPPPPAAAGTEPAPSPAEAATRVTAAPVFQPIADLPQTVRRAVEQMRVHAILYAPVARHRLAMVEGRQLREGDDVMAGVRLDEIKPQGLVLRHGSVRVLLPTSFAGPRTQAIPTTTAQEAT